MGRLLERPIFFSSCNRTNVLIMSALNVCGVFNICICIKVNVDKFSTNMAEKFYHTAQEKASDNLNFFKKFFCVEELWSPKTSLG